MELQNFHIDKIFQIIDKEIISIELFNGYKAVEHKVYKISSPTIIVVYDTIYINENADRWLFIKVEEYSNYAKLRIDLNKLLVKESSNLNIENYFLEKYNDRKITKLMSFTINSEQDFKECLEKIFVYINKNSDKTLQEIFCGNHWEKQIFDWNNYK